MSETLFKRLLHTNISQENQRLNPVRRYMNGGTISVTKIHMKNLGSIEIVFGGLRHIYQHMLAVLCCYTAMEGKHNIAIS